MTATAPEVSAPPERSARVPRRFICLAILLAAGAAAVWLSHDWLRAPLITNDGYQYLDAAASVRAGGCLCTSMAYFDEQVAPGHLPVALTHYPPGYPLLIAGLSNVGLSPEAAGYLLSVAAFLAGIWLLWDLCLLLGSRLDVAFLITLAWISSKAALTYASGILTEMPFALLFTALIALVIRDIRTRGRHSALLCGIGALAGAAYFIRYAGLFLIPPAVLYLACRAWQRRESRRGALAGVFALCAFAAPIWVHNFLAMGAWQGQFLSNAPFGVVSAIALLGPASYHLVLGEVTPVPYVLWTALLCLAAAGGFIRRFRSGQRIKADVAWAAAFVVAYVAGVLLAKARMTNMNADMSDVIRYLVPAYPTILACLAAMISGIRSEGLRTGVSFAVGFVMVIQAMNFLLRPAPPEHVVMAAVMSGKLLGGESVGQWLLTNVPAGGVVVAEEGQALHYLTGRPVVSIVEPPENSNGANDGPGIRALMSRYRSRYLLTFPVLRGSRGSLPFIRDLGRGDVPDWLVRLPGTADVGIYECKTCIR